MFVGGKRTGLGRQTDRQADRRGGGGEGGGSEGGGGGEGGGGEAAAAEAAAEEATAEEATEDQRRHIVLAGRSIPRQIRCEYCFRLT